MGMHNSESANILCIGMGWFPETPGGLNRYVYEFIQHLKSDRVELCGVGLPAAPLNEAIALTNLAAPSSPIWQRLWSARTAFLQKPRAKADAINLHFALYSLPLLLNLPKRVPITFTFHGPWALESQQETQNSRKAFLQQWVEQRVYDRCDRFIVLSKAFGQILHDTYQVPWAKIHIIPGGVNITRFQPNFSRQDARDRLGWPADRKILFTPRRLVNRMGVDQLLTAMVQVKAQVPEVWLAIAGKGPRRESLEQQAQALGLQDQVKFLGYLPDDQLPIAYQAADLTVVPSQSLEGFGLILLESLACGTPAFCTPVGGMPEVIAPLSPDLISRSTEAAAIADRLIAVLTQEALPSREACRDYACSQFDWEAIAPRVRAVLLN